jgi:hypothetical protein
MEAHRDSRVAQAIDFLADKRFDTRCDKRGDLGLQRVRDSSYLTLCIKIAGDDNAQDKRSEKRKIPNE